MARADGIEVKVDIHMTVSDEMADRCLKLLEWWQNDHAEQNITITQGADGSVHLYRARSKTFSGIDRAMAEQWGGYVEQEGER